MAAQFLKLVFGIPFHTHRISCFISSYWGQKIYLIWAWGVPFHKLSELNRIHGSLMWKLLSARLFNDLFWWLLCSSSFCHILPPGIKLFPSSFFNPILLFQVPTHVPVTHVWMGQPAATMASVPTLANVHLCIQALDVKLPSVRYSVLVFAWFMDAWFLTRWSPIDSDSFRHHCWVSSNYYTLILMNCTIFKLLFVNWISACFLKLITILYICLTLLSFWIV